MVRKVTPAQARAAINKANREQKRAVDNYNRGVRRHNAALKKAVGEYNREVRAYNSKARAHNARVDNQRRRLQQEIHRLNSRPIGTTFANYRTSAEALAAAYTATETRFDDQSVTQEVRSLIDRASDEAANSIYLLNAMDGAGSPEQDPTEDELRGPSMQAELATFGQDLVDRWNGALLALSPQNPDAARHFCTSAREVLVTMMNSAAPDARVVESDPGCALTDRGVPTRRAKVEFLLQHNGIHEPSVVDLVDQDVENVLTLFRDFNNGTHGHAGRFTITQLNALRVRVESAVNFIYTLCGD